MNLKAKVRAVVAAVALACSGAAVADIAPGNANGTNAAGGQGNGELFLSVWSPSLQTSYTRDLGIRMDHFLAGGTIRPDDVAAGNAVDFTFATYNTAAIPTESGSVTAPGYKLVFGTDTALTNSLLTASDTIWSVVALDSLGSDRGLFTANFAGGVPPAMTDTQLANSVATNALAHVNAVNSLPSHAGTTANYLTQNWSSTTTFVSPPSPISYSGNSSFGTQAGGLNFNTTSAIGTSLGFWLVSENASGTNAIFSPFTGGTWSLDSAGVLTWQVAAIPETSTWAMMLAGFAVLLGIGRRRMAV